MTALAGAPDWALPYWTWKSALGAPWLPSARLVAELYSPMDRLYPSAPESIVYKFAGEVVWTAYAHRFQDQFGPGGDFGWAPFAMAAMAFVDQRRGILSVLDRAGHKHDVMDAKGVFHLPAWSPDGLHIAWLAERRLGFDLLLADVVVSR